MAGAREIKELVEQELKLENLAVAKEIKELERSVFSQFDSTDAEISALVGQLALKEAKHEEKKKERVSTLSEIEQDTYEIEVLEAKVRDETENVQRLGADIQKWELECLALMMFVHDDFVEAQR